VLAEAAVSALTIASAPRVVLGHRQVQTQVIARELEHLQSESACLYFPKSPCYGTFSFHSGTFGAGGSPYYGLTYYLCLRKWDTDEYRQTATEGRGARAESAADATGISSPDLFPFRGAVAHAKFDGALGEY
jgi:hypothetical protein